MIDFLHERWLLELLTLVWMVAITGFVVLERRRPVSTMAWLLALIFLPFVGLVLYVVFGRLRVRKRRRLRARRGVQPTLATNQLAPLETPIAELDPPLRGLVALAMNATDAPLRRCDTTDLLPVPETAYHAMEAAMRGAQSWPGSAAMPAGLPGVQTPSRATERPWISAPRGRARLRTVSCSRLLALWRATRRRSSAR